MNIEDKIKLVTGKGNWHTNDCDEKYSSIHLSDGPHGVRSQAEDAASNNDSCKAVCFPTASAISCSWDTQAISTLAKALAEEAISENVSVLLGPGVCMKRSPLCGRNFEYFSEDPYLTGKLSAAYIKAVQSKKIATSLKHFAGNNQETYRQTSNSQIDERALHEIYLRAFEIAVKEGKPATIMASYNMLNGIYSCENKELLTDILRKKWGFKGLVMSDWGACVDLSSCLKAGMDLEMPDSRGIHSKILKKDLENGKITDEEITIAAERVLALVKKYTVKDSTLSAEQKNKLLERNHELARQLEEESAVLLQNDGILPLETKNAKTAKKAATKASTDEQDNDIIVIGEMARSIRYQGGGSSHINAYKTPSVVDSFTNLGYNVHFASAYKTDVEESDDKLEEEALNVIRQTKNHDKILFFGGLTDLIEGEGFDRANMQLPRNQIDFFNRMKEEFPQSKIVFVAFSGSAFEIPFAKKVNAILYMALGGEAVGEAAVNLLTGKANPSGKLSETFPLHGRDVPSSDFFGKDTHDVQYRESIFVGYRYYDSFNIPVLFPFGTGLSYTTFKYASIKVTKKTSAYTVSLNVKNTGKAAGAEIVQIYVQNPPAKFLRANKELCGFSKVFLKPGETKKIEIELNDRAFSIYDDTTHDFVTVPGNYKIIASPSINEETLTKEVKIKGVEYAKDERKILPSYFSRNGRKICISEKEFKVLYKHEFSHLDRIYKGNLSKKNSLRQLAQYSLLAKILLFFIPLFMKILFKGKNPNDPEMRMILEMTCNGTLDCITIQSKGMISEKLCDAIVLSSNGHIIQSFIRFFKKN